MSGTTQSRPHDSGPTARAPAPNPGDLGRRVAIRRVRLGLDRKEIAARAGMAPNFLAYLETRPVMIGTSTLIRLARALETSPSDLLGGAAEPAPVRAGASPAPAPDVTEHGWGTVSGLMTQAVVAVSQDATFRDMAEALRTWRVSALPVLVGDGRVIGVVSEADLLAARTRAGSDGSVCPDLTAGQLMTSPAITVHPEAPAADAARTMVQAHLKCLPVVDSGGRLAGVVSRGDLVQGCVSRDGDLAARVRPADTVVRTTGK